MDEYRVGDGQPRRVGESPVEAELRRRIGRLALIQVVEGVLLFMLFVVVVVITVGGEGHG